MIPLYWPKTIYLFLARHFVVCFGVLYAGIATMIALIEIIELVRRLSTKASLSLPALFGMALLKVPVMLEVLFPTIILIAMLSTLWFLGRKQELQACRLAGLSFWQLALPFVIATIGLRVLAIVVINPIGASCLAHFERLEARIMHHATGTLSISEHGIWIKHRFEKRQAIIRIAGLEGQSLKNINVFEFNDHFDLVRHVYAARGYFHDGNLVLAQAQANLLDGSRIPIADIAIPSPLNFSSLIKSGRSPATLSVWTLPEFITVLDKSGLSSARHRLHWHRLFAHGVLSCAFVLIVMGYIFKQPTWRNLISLRLILLAIASGLSMLFIGDVTWALGLSGRLPLWFAAWSPALIAMMLGTMLVLNLEDSR